MQHNLKCVAFTKTDVMIVEAGKGGCGNAIKGSKDADYLLSNKPVQGWAGIIIRGVMSIAK